MHDANSNSLSGRGMVPGNVQNLCAEASASIEEILKKHRRFPKKKK